MPSILSIRSEEFAFVFSDDPDDREPIKGTVFHIYFLRDERGPSPPLEDHPVNEVLRLLKFIIDLVVPEAGELGTASKLERLEHSMEPVLDKPILHRERLNRVKMGLKHNFNGFGYVIRLC